MGSKMKYLLLILPLAACGPHVDRCLTFPLPPECTQEGGGGLSLLAGGDVPPKPEPEPAPAPEPQPEPPAPEPKPEPPKPDHDDDKDDHDAHDDADSGDEADDEDEDDGEDTGDRYGSSTHGEADDD